MDWNSRYLAGDTPWEKGAPTPVLKEMEERLGAGLWKGEGPLLVPGCGLGHDARWLAARGVTVIGLDVAPEAVEGARRATEGANPSFILGDFFQPRDGGASVIWEHTCFCAIEPSQRLDYARSAAQWLPAGGLLVGSFFLTPENEDPGPPYGTTVAELDATFGPAFEVVEEWEPVTGYPGRVGHEWARVMRRRARA